MREVQNLRGNKIGMIFQDPDHQPEPAYRIMSNWSWALARRRPMTPVLDLPRQRRQAGTQGGGAAGFLAERMREQSASPTRMSG